MCPKRNTAFSLLELTLVSATALVLAVVLLPSLNRVREQAQVAACAGSHRAAYDLMACYAGEYKEYPGYDVNRTYRWWYERSFPTENLIYDPNGFWCDPPLMLKVDPPTADQIPEAESGGFLTDKSDPNVPYKMFLLAGLIGNSANDWARFQCPTRPHVAVGNAARNGGMNFGTYTSPPTATPPKEVYNFGNGFWFGYNGPNVGARAADAVNWYSKGPGTVSSNKAGMWTDIADGAIFTMGGQSGVCGGGQAAGQTWGISLRDGQRHYGNNGYRPSGWYSVSDFAFLACPGLPGGREPHMNQELNYGEPNAVNVDVNNFYLYVNNFSPGFSWSLQSPPPPPHVLLDRNFTFGDGHTSYLSKANRNDFHPSDHP